MVAVNFFALEVRWGASSFLVAINEDRSNCYLSVLYEELFRNVACNCTGNLVAYYFERIWGCGEII